MASDTSGSPTKKPVKRAATSGTKSAKRPVKRTRVPDERADSSSQNNTAARAEARPPARASKIASEAMGELTALTGKDVEGVTGLERSDNGWLVRVEVVELRRIPDTTDVLALYEVETDSSGVLQGYQRIRRYVRGVPDND